MEPVSTEVSNREDFGFFTRALASWCHDCRLCSYSGTNPDSGFGKLMEWHRGWCPAWAARIRVYGDEDLSLQPIENGTTGGK
jgi:hypothetical protein